MSRNIEGKHFVHLLLLQRLILVIPDSMSSCHETVTSCKLRAEVQRKRESPFYFLKDRQYFKFGMACSTALPKPHVVIIHSFQMELFRNAHHSYSPSLQRFLHFLRKGVYYFSRSLCKPCSCGCIA